MHPFTIAVPWVRIYDILCVVRWLNNTPILLSANSLKTMVLSEKQTFLCCYLVLLQLVTHTSEIQFLIAKDGGIMGISIWLHRLTKSMTNMNGIQFAHR
jgi:hypothetical protein